VVPGQFDRVADGPFHTGGRYAEFAGYLRVQFLGDRVQNIHIVRREQDGFPQIAVSLDVYGMPDLCIMADTIIFRFHSTCTFSSLLRDDRDFISPILTLAFFDKYSTSRPVIRISSLIHQKIARSLTDDLSHIVKNHPSSFKAGNRQS
jgi:hypothetical protein